MAYNIMTDIRLVCETTTTIPERVREAARSKKVETRTGRVSGMMIFANDMTRVASG